MPLEMTRLTLQKFSATEFANEFSVAHGDFATNGDRTRAAFEFPAFEGAVIDIHVLRLHRNFAAIFGIEHDEVGIGTGLDGAFAWKEVEGFRDLCARDVHKGVQVDLSRFHAV